MTRFLCGREGAPWRWLVVVALSLASCLASGASDAPEACRADSDCPEPGAACNEERGVCLARPSPPSGTIVLSVADPHTGDWQSVQLQGEDLVDGFTEVHLDAPVFVRGTLSDERSASAQAALAATLRFRRVSEYVELTRQPVFVEAVDDLLGEADSEVLYNYGVSLLPGIFDVEIEPLAAGQGGPPSYPLRQQVELVPADGLTMLSFAYDDDTRYVEGQVVNGEGQGLSGVQVYAYEPGQGPRVSNVALTSCSDEVQEDCGSFSLAMPEATTAFRLRVMGTGSNAWLPQLDLGEFSFDHDDGDGRLVTSELGGPLRYEVSDEAVLVNPAVLAQARDGTRLPLAGARVEFRCPPTQEGVVPPRQYVLSASTDDDGRFIAPAVARPPGGDRPGIMLRPDCGDGCYEVTIIPPVNSRYARNTSRICVSDGGEQVDGPLGVGPRRYLKGAVRDPRGVPLADAQVEASNAHGGVFHTTTGLDGSFELFVDPAEYELLVIPPAQYMSLSWVRQSEVSVFEDLELSETIMVPWGTLLRGEVRAEAGQVPLARAVVEGYVVTDSHTRSLQKFGSTFTDDEGYFEFAVPPTP